MKIAINKDFGGFGLSEEAFELLLNRKGIAFEKQEDEDFFEALYFYAGRPHIPDNCIDKYEFYKNRTDADLVAVIEQLLEAANDRYASLAVVEVPDDVSWHIAEYSGLEHVAENHRTWY